MKIRKKKLVKGDLLPKVILRKMECSLDGSSDVVNFDKKNI